MTWTLVVSTYIYSCVSSFTHPVTICFTLILYYILFVCQKPKIYSGNQNLLRFLHRYVKSSETFFRPAIPLWDGRLQTMFGMKRLTNTPKLPYEREILKLSDGGKVALDFLYKQPSSGEINQNGNKEQLMVVILPGLASSSQSGYIKAIAQSIVQTSETSVVVLNSRGIGGVPLETPRVFSATDCEDLREAMEYLKKTRPSTKFMALGTSMGGIILTHYLVKYPEEAKQDLITALIISVVWDPWCSCYNLEKGLINSKMLNYPLAKSLLNVATKHKKVLETEERFDLAKMQNCKTLREVDECYTAPLCGYASLDDYYQHARIQQRIDELPIPVVALNACDDPMSPEAALPIEGAKKCKNLALVVTERGGHLGFLEALWLKSTKMHFMDSFVSQYVKGVNLFSEELTKKDLHDLEGLN